MNYNISIEIDRVPGAKVMEIKDRRCVVIPIDNDRGMCVDAYEKFDHKLGGMTMVPLKSVRLNLTANESRDVRFGSHYLKPSFSKEFYKTIAEEDRKNIPIIGNLKPMAQREAGKQPDHRTNSINDEW